MPAPIDWSAAGGLEAVKTLTISLGPREAARKLNLSQSHSEALRRMCSRGKWMDAVRPQPAPMPASMSQPLSVVVPVVPTTSQAFAESHVENGRRGRLAASRASAKALEHLADLAPDEIAESSRALKDLADVSGKAGGWQDQASGVTVNVLNMRFD